MKTALLLSLIAGLGLVGCSSLPTAGPTTSQILDQAAQEGQRRFDVVDVNYHVVATQSARPTASFRTQFQDSGKPQNPKIEIGDTLSVSIWEAAAGGLFGPAQTETVPGAAATSGGAHNVTIPEQVVAPDGGISVPYAGRVRAAGRTPLEVQRTIEQRLAERAIEPQAIVTITKSVSDDVTVSGELISGARVPLSVGGDRLLDVIAAAGGAKSPLYETFVRLSRGGVTVTIPMSVLVSDPAENIYAWPNDVITLIRTPQTFSAFGATGSNTQIPFNADRVNLAQAIAKAGGLEDVRADPAGVFLFRFEPPPVAKALGAPAYATAPDGTAAILYHLDLRQAVGYFLAERFPVEDDDIIYVANAPLVQTQKFFNLVSSITGPVISGVVVSRSTSTTH